MELAEATADPSNRFMSSAFLRASVFAVTSVHSASSPSASSPSASYTFTVASSIMWRMCDLGHPHEHPSFGFLVDTPEIRALIGETRRLMAEMSDDGQRVEALRPAFAALLASEGWLPDDCARPDERSRMGGGIGQYALYRAEDGSLCLFSLVVPAGAETPVHDHLAWGLVGIYRGRQDETVYRRLDDGSDPEHADLEVAKRQTLSPGEFYTLIPPTDDIHYVKTVSATASISIHLLANDTACVWRHRFDPTARRVTPFRSGYANAPCPEEDKR